MSISDSSVNWKATHEQYHVLANVSIENCPFCKQPGLKIAPKGLYKAGDLIIVGSLAYKKPC